MGVLNHPDCKKIEFQKSKMADGRHFAKSVKSPYLGSGSTNFDEIWHDDAYWSLTADRPLKVLIFDSLIWQTAAILRIEKLLNCNYSITQIWQ